MPVTPFRQPIRPGDSGMDVIAVKRAMQKMGVKGAGALNVSEKAGPQFVVVLNTILRQHHEKQDSVYGSAAHEIIAPHFDAHGVHLYSTAALRKPPLPPIPAESAQAEAIRLLELHKSGGYQADNPGDLHDLQATAEGKPVWSQGGYWVHIDPRPLRLLVWLIVTEGYSLGTFALCSDHHDDGPHGHAGGLAVDISTINGHSIAAAGAHDLTLAVARKIATSGVLRPRQLICDGAGWIHYSDISAWCIPSAGFYGYPTLAEHRNHIHAGA